MKTSKRHYLWISLIMIMTAGLLSACQQNKNSITAVGSTALQPLVEEAAYAYGNKHGVTINVQGGGSGTGLSQVAEGSVAIGDSDLFVEQKQGIPANKLVDHRVAVVGIVPVVNPGVGVKNLSMDQLRAIFAGKITNWKEIGGKNQSILLIHRGQGSGTRFTFEQDVMGKTSVAPGQEQDSNGSVQKIVKATPGAISYLAFAYANQPGLQKLQIDHVVPTKTNVTTNEWKIWSYEHMYTNKNKHSKLTEQFLQYLQTPAVQQDLIAKLGYISIHDMKVVKDIDGNVTPLKKGLGK